MGERPGAVGVFPAYRILNEAGDVLDTITPPEWSAAQALRLHDVIISVGALVRTDVARANPWDPELRYVGDYDFWLRVGLDREIVRVAEPLACHRAHPASTTQLGLGNRAKALESVRAVDMVFEREGLPADVQAVRAEAYQAAFISAGLMMASELGENDRFLVIDRHGPTISEAAARASLAAQTPHGVLARMYRRVLPQRVRDSLWRAAPNLMARLRSGRV
jgi:hypothetical protein